MVSDIAAYRPLLRQGNFEKLFNELGWDRFQTQLTIPIGTETFTLSAVAEKRGVQIFQCAPQADGKIPEYAIRRKIETEVTKAAFHHVLIFTDAGKSNQVWQWVSREAGKPLAYREQAYHVGQSGDALLQKLERISFPLSEEEGLTLSGVTFKLKDAFDKERVTKRFYDRFQKEHVTFLGFIENIPDAEFQRWYASVMINRLMFLYFIQSKGFLNSDTSYLQNRLKESQGRFYQDFLCPLFFEGFAKRAHSDKIIKKLGKVPYLNGGLFAKHQIESDPDYGHLISIPDTAFEKLFAFFDDYNWHLDDRPLKNDKEINPDVLGYIFEKYINQKQMGAYYTKEDITEYIGKNTILPFLLDRAREDCQVAFAGVDGLWRLLREDPDRYIYPAVRYGTEHALPEAIARGIESVAARGEWNKPAPAAFALPTEIWREVVARRQRYDEVRAKMMVGEVHEVADLITYNLSIRQFTEDCIAQGGTDFLLAVWNVLNGTPEGRLPMSVLDPTCGSGAFLFAALEILEPLYETCLDRMASFVSDADLLGHPKDHPRFRAILQGAAVHADRRYFVLKSIIVNNLYGVDIMEEATEICKLRLFLKLAAQVEADPSKEDFGIEPLPDIDFNIRAGNTLVGFATEAQVRFAITGRDQTAMDFDDKWLSFQAKAAAAAKMFVDFQRSQNDAETTSEFSSLMKKGLRERLRSLADELDKYLGHQYGKISKESQAAWKQSAQPFHWFIEFYNVLKAGGFDAIIGNPPYVEYSAVKTSYLIRSFDTESCGNLFAFTLERALLLLNKVGSFSFIVPISLVCTQRMAVAQDALLKKFSSVWVSDYAERPGKLFNGAEVLLTIVIGSGRNENLAKIWSTGLTKWSAEERNKLFERTLYQPFTAKPKPYVFPKLSSFTETDILQKLLVTKRGLGLSFASTSAYRVYYRIGGGRYWKIFTSFQPHFELGHVKSVSSRESYLYFDSEDLRDSAISILSSTLFYWYFILTTNCRDLNPSDLREFPVNLRDMSHSNIERLTRLCHDLMQDYKKNSKRKEKESKQTGHVVYEEFYPRQSKFIIDQIDRVLAKHYGFTDEETDFIINYDIKYRMGRGGDEAED